MARPGPDSDPPFGATDGRSAVGWVSRNSVLNAFWSLFRVFGDGPIRVTGELPPPGCVVAMHHNAVMDAFALALPARKAGHVPIALIKDNLFKHAALGPIVRTAGMVPVIRHSEEGRKRAYQLGLEHLAKGNTLFIAPSGTVTHTQEVDIATYRPGAARMAEEAGVPIAPAVVLGPHRWGGHKRPLKPQRNTPITVHYGKPFDPAGDSATKVANLAKAIGDLLDEAYAAYPEPGTGQWWWPVRLGGTADPVPTEPAA